MNMTRDEFRKAVFNRDNNKCVNCGEPAQDSHHIIERRLFTDGGYDINNGASLCGKCHILAESTELSCDIIREKAKINKIILPNHLYDEYKYDKWGNIIRQDGTRLPGELFYDESVQKILSPVIYLFVKHVKYPRSFHLPWSESLTKDDRMMSSVEQFIGQEIIVSEKMDGENTTFYNDHIHARAIDSGSHPSRTWVKRIHAQIAHEIPDGWRIVGENLQAKHSILYTSLPSYFMMFAMFDNKGLCLSWDEIVEWAKLLELEVVPLLYRGIYDESIVKSCFTGISKCGGEQEGYVIRLAKKFPVSTFHKSIGKFVRKNHVQTVEHNWLNKSFEENKLR